MTRPGAFIKAKIPQLKKFLQMLLF